MFPWHQYLLGLLFVVAGVTHFTKSHWYERVLPPYIPNHKSVVLVSGIIEMILGFMLLNSDSQSMAAWSIMVLMILFLPVHIHMASRQKCLAKTSKMVTNP